MWNIEKADNIPMVIETKRAIGHRLLSVSVPTIFKPLLKKILRDFFANIFLFYNWSSKSSFKVLTMIFCSKILKTNSLFFVLKYQFADFFHWNCIYFFFLNWRFNAISVIFLTCQYLRKKNILFYFRVYPIFIFSLFKFVNLYENKFFGVIYILFFFVAFLFQGVEFLYSLF